MGVIHQFGKYKINDTEHIDLHNPIVGSLKKSHRDSPDVAQTMAMIHQFGRHKIYDT